MPTRKPLELIAMGRALNWPERILALKEMRELIPYHKIDYCKRLKQVMKQVRTGNYEPILLSSDKPHVVIDGNMRLKACRKLRIPIKAMLTPWTRYHIEQVQKLRDKGILHPVMKGDNPMPTPEQIEQISKELGL